MGFCLWTLAASLDAAEAVAPNYRADPQATAVSIDIAAMRASYAKLSLGLAQQWLAELDGVQRAAVELDRRPRARNLALMRELLAKAQHTWQQLSALCRVFGDADVDVCVQASAPLEALAAALAKPLRARDLSASGAAIDALKTEPTAAMAQATRLIQALTPGSDDANAVIARNDFEYLGRLLGAMVDELELSTGALPGEPQVSALRVLYFGQTETLALAGLSAALIRQLPGTDARMQLAIGALAPKVRQGAAGSEIDAARRNLGRAIRDLGLALKVQVVVPGL